MIWKTEFVKPVPVIDYSLLQHVEITLLRGRNYHQNRLHKMIHKVTDIPAGAKWLSVSSRKVRRNYWLEHYFFMEYVVKHHLKKGNTVVIDNWQRYTPQKQQVLLEFFSDPRWSNRVTLISYKFVENVWELP